MSEKPNKTSKPSAGKRRREASSNSPEGVATSSTTPIQPKQGTSTSTSGRASGGRWKKTREKHRESGLITLSPPIASENIRKFLNALKPDALSQERDTLNAAYNKLEREVDKIVEKDRDALTKINGYKTEKNEEEAKPDADKKKIEELEDSINGQKEKRPPLRDQYNKQVNKYYKPAWQGVQSVLKDKYKIDIKDSRYSDKTIKGLVDKIEGKKDN